MNKKTKLIVIIAVLAVIILAAAWYFIIYSQKKVLVASGHSDWPPIMYQQNDQIVGAGPEIALKIFEELGIKAVSKYEGPWDIVQEKAQGGTVDVLVAAYKTAYRETYMDYSIPYTVDPVVLVVKKGKAFPYEKWEDLVSKKGIVTSGDSYGQEFDNFIATKLNVVKVGTPQEAFAALDKGEVDYFVYALYSVQGYIYKNKLADQVEILPKYVSTENFYLTISKKSPFNKYLPQINSLLEKYKADGTIDRIIEKYKNSLWNETK
ncbi:MAG: transporter substrate-binding domain-containing protein [Patescibacteria group bacterium]|jgi:polar amino acid transport system substrate-binding protein